MKRITVYDIAREAQVSVATVSRVLNNTAPVRPATKARVQALIDKYQFQPNALARSLFKKATGMLGVIIPDITNPFFPTLLAGLDQQARKHGYTIFLCDTVSTEGEYADQYERESEYLNLLMEKRVDGIVWIGGRINLARPSAAQVKEIVDVAQRVPLLLVNGQVPGADVHRVYVDEREGAQLATQYLIHLGHRDIAFVGGYSYMSNTLQRLQGFQRAMRDNGLKPRKEWVLDGDFSVDSGKQYFNRLLQLSTLPTAVFCANDLVAVGVMKAAHKAGIRVPEDLSIVGFDDIPYAANSIPELTTVSLKCYEVGRIAADQICGMMDGDKAIKTIKVRPELAIRESAAPVSVANKMIDNAYSVE
ncbi:LacI family transcriptional regulator [Paenibacillus sp. 598K]|uniref:LacI family DNA-binding transcriptional regulator n=1 Tax=Paenibacillus sp. 598K TaxID=1117987 RepID=UPI000FF99061|nr:LacI family DNA-binding transcriptional regulator [Paenibacillus sp. 598K]GBF73773.1 LacI family transcriptional regulator [Paenibacillus sp. 598K]